MVHPLVFSERTPVLLQKSLRLFFFLMETLFSITRQVSRQRIHFQPVTLSAA
jgi:hypothetical protein